MAKIRTLSFEKHKNLRFSNPKNYFFIKNKTLAPLIISELYKAAVSFPIVFTKEKLFQENCPEERFTLCALLGLRDNENLYVSSEGYWMSDYVPAIYRAYPFMIAHTGDKEKFIIAIDEESEFLSEEEGIPIFEATGDLSEEVKKIIKFLNEVVAGYKKTQRICQILEETELLTPYPITIKTQEKDIKIEGIFGVDQKKLNNLSTDQLELLYKEGALPVIYCHIISLQNLSFLATLFNIRLKEEKTLEEIKQGIFEDVIHLGFDE